MKALVKKRDEPGLWLENVPEPAIGINDLLIRVLRTGICGTDLHIFEWDDWARKTIPTPLIIGHEFVGRVVTVGENVNDFHPGDIVSGEWHLVCGRCRNCIAGRRHLCAHTRGIGVNRHIVGTDLNRSRLDLAMNLGATRAVDVRETSLPVVQSELGMQEGFDVGLEMSGNPAALRDMVANLAHGGRIAMLGVPATEIAIDWNLVVFNMLTIKGIYGREMYETWYMMTVMLQSGLDISPVITHRFDFGEYETAFEAARSGQAGKIILRWGDL